MPWSIGRSSRWISSLVLLLAHHLEVTKQIVVLLRWMEATVKLGWFINDLERAQWSFRCLGWCGWHPGLWKGMTGRCRSGEPSGRRIGYACWLRLMFLGRW